MVSRSHNDVKYFAASFKWYIAALMSSTSSFAMMLAPVGYICYYYSMLTDDIKDLIFSYVPSLKMTPSGWYKANCPVCQYRGESEDKRERFGIRFDHSSFGMNCFNCKFQSRWEEGGAISKNLGWFLEHVGVPDAILAELKFNAHREKEERESFVLPESAFATKKAWVQKSLPPDAISLLDWANEGCDDPDFINVFNYAYGRKIEDFANFYWSPNKTFQMNKRLIIPFLYKNVIVGYTARYYNNTHAKQIPKYISDSPDSFVYNLDEQHHSRKYVILCEGALDAYIVSGIACLGNNINQKQVDVINNLNKKVILCPDRDMAGENTIKVAMENEWEVSFPNWGEGVKDASEAVNKYGKILTVQSILESTIKNPLKVYVSRKFDNFKS